MEDEGGRGGLMDEEKSLVLELGCEGVGIFWYGGGGGVFEKARR